MRRIKIRTIDSQKTRCLLSLLFVLLLAAASASQKQPSRLANAYYNRGNERYKKGDLDGAIVDFDAALTFNPRLAVAYYNRGKARNDKGNLEGSIADYSSAIEIKPHLVTAYIDRGPAKKGDVHAAGVLFGLAPSVLPVGMKVIGFNLGGRMTIACGELIEAEYDDYMPPPLG